jgi:hypothetical protein
LLHEAQSILAVMTSRLLVLAGLFAGCLAPAANAADPPLTPAPKAKCGPGSVPEPGLQGRVAKEDVESGKAADGYRCNMKVVGQSGETGGFKVLRYVDKAGHECAYYDTTLLFPTNTFNLSLELTGVAVLDMSNPAKPVRTATLSTPAMQSPHESLNISVNRGLLAAVAGNPAFLPGVVDVYDISGDCRQPALKSTAPVGFLGHESGMAPDGNTFYATSIGSGHTTPVDISDPSLPKPLGVYEFNSHGMTVSDNGMRGYMASGDGLIITDLSQIQERKASPQIPEISRLTWPSMTIPQVAHPVTIDGKPYLVEVDEYSEVEDGGSATANGPRVGAARIIDISDETKPRVVSNVRLEVHQPEHRMAIADDYGAQNPTQGYAAHYCNVPRRKDPGIMACSMILSGLRVFDIRDPEHPKEIAYFVAPPDTVSTTGGPVIDERANWAMSQPDFVPERGEIWYSDGTSGFWALKVSPDVWPFRSALAARPVDRSIDVRVKSPRLASDSLRGRKVRLRIRGKKGLGAISHFVLQYRRTGRGTKRTYTTLRPRLAKSTRRVAFRKGRVGETYLFRITAVGVSGKRSPFHHSRTAFPYDDRGKGRRYSKGWRRIKNRRAWLGGYSQTSRRGATLDFATRGGGRIYLVARTGPNGGRALFGRGTKKRVVSFRTRIRRNRRVVAVVNRTDKRVYHFRVRVLSGTVTLDGFAVRRR